MALPTASDNPFPSLLLNETSAPAAPAASKRRLYIDAAHVLRWKDSAALDSPLAALNKWDATVAPAVTDDSGDGYAVGSRWIDTTANKEYVCLDDTVGAAVWTETTGGGGGGVTYGTPALTLGTANAAGSTDEAIRRDATLLAFDATAPSTQAFGDSAAAGAATVAARRDHKHAMPATPTTVSGNAGTATALQTSRNIDGQAFNGTADITVIAPGTHAATTKATPVDADELPLVDSAALNVLKKLTWANLKATIKAYTDTLYTAIGASAPPNGSAGGVLDGSYPNPGLAAGVAGDGLAEASDVLSVNVDGSTIEIDADALRVKALGITDAHVAAANKDGVAGTASMRTLGTGATQAAAGTDSRLSDARTPTAHADSHKPGGTDALMTVVRAAGTSTSGTATTTVAEITAAASTQFVGWTIAAAQANAANTQFKIIVTYSDATTDTDTSVAATGTQVQANAGGILKTQAAALVAVVALQAKAVTGLRVETAGVGTGNRGAVISAIQAPL